MKKRKNIQYLKVGNLAHIAAAFGEKLKDSQRNPTHEVLHRQRVSFCHLFNGFSLKYE